MLRPSPRRCFAYLKHFAIILLIFVLFVYNSSRSTERKEFGKSLGFDPPSPEDEDVMNMDQEDARLITWITKHHLRPPSNHPRSIAGKDHKNDWSGYVDGLFQAKMKRNPGWKGIFVEAGAFDGVTWSNSLFLEEKGWTGLLVECNPMTLPTLISKNRNAWIADVCLSLFTTPKLVNFSSLPEWAGSSQMGAPLTPEQMRAHGIGHLKNRTWVNYEVTSVPLYSIIKAAGITEVDFLSLDVQGAEIDILKGFPFHKLKIKVMVVEVVTFTDLQKEDLRNFLREKGYNLTMKGQADDAYILKDEPDFKLTG